MGYSDPFIVLSRGGSLILLFMLTAALLIGIDRYWKQLLSTVIAAEPRDYWISKLQAASVVAAPVLSYAEVIAEPHMWENGYLTHMEVPGHGTKRVQGVAIRFAGTPVPPTMAAGPALGADTAAFETLLRSDGGVTRPSKL